MTPLMQVREALFPCPFDIRALWRGATSLKFHHGLSSTYCDTGVGGQDAGDGESLLRWSRYVWCLAEDERIGHWTLA